ncbi:MAG: hypothetical protein ABL904_17170 [Hyphomicrobiaceae bacterium]
MFTLMLKAATRRKSDDDLTGLEEEAPDDTVETYFQALYGDRGALYGVPDDEQDQITAERATVLEQLEADLSVTRSDMIALARRMIGYGPGRTRDVAFSAIKTRVLGWEYDIESNRMASRATPW